MTPTEDIINREAEKATKVLKKGGIIVYPTDTIWGIGCDATNRKAVDKVYKLKKRIPQKSLIVLIRDKEELMHYVDMVPDMLWDFAENVTSPLTVIYQNARRLPKNIIAPDGTVAIRITQDTFCRKLIHLSGKPIVSTSANISGGKTPLVYSMISEDILNSVDYVVDYKRNEITEVRPSTIVKITEEGQIDILRS